jgi:hypothetical protein
VADEHLFRFLSVRPANPERKLEQAPAKVPLYTAQAPPSDFRRAVVQVLGTEGAAAAIKDLVQKFHDDGLFVDDLGALKLLVPAAIDWSLANAALLTTDPAVSSGLADALGTQPLAKVVETTAFRDAEVRIADSIYAETLVPTAGERVSYDRLVLAHKLLTFARELVRKASFPSGATVGYAVGARTVVLGSAAARQPNKPQPQTQPTPSDPRPQRIAEIKDALAELEGAHAELSEATVQPGALEAIRADRPSIDSRLQTLERGFATTATSRAVAPPATPDDGSSPAASTDAARIQLTTAAVGGLSTQVREVVKGLQLSIDELDPIHAVGRIERRMTALGAELASLSPPQAFVRVGGVEIQKSRLVESLGIDAWRGRPEVLISDACRFAAGVGDLLIVKQRLKAYEVGDFAYVENVLAGETRDREHRRLDTSEEMTTTESETSTEKEKDLQSTTRNELQTEADKTVKEQFGLEAGLQVSGSYGPTVQFAAHLNANYSTTSEETQRKAVSFSQEITQKSSEKVTERVKQSLTRRVVQEIQEINRHTFTNTSNTKHIRGVYRWLNKIYDAQILNYGQRMMYEFVVPEPATWFLYAMVDNPPTDSEIIKPEPPTYLGAPLQPSHLTRTNYQTYVARYQVRGVPAPPPEFQHAAYFDKQDKVQDGSNFGRAGKIEVPGGYEAFGATVMADYAYTKDSEHTFHIILGGSTFDFSDVWGAEYQALQTRSRELSIACALFNAWNFALGVDVVCRLADDGLTKWRQMVYDAITEAYLRMKADYEEKRAVEELHRGPNLGRNPLENKRIVDDELKKLVLMMLTGSNDIARDSYYSSTEPLMRLDSACKNGSWIRFFENAFEWTNLVYVFYPYFWGRHARWISAIHLTDPDPDFASFLRAGAARVQVPVRPGFEKAVAHFCQFGQIWNGNDPPLRDDDLYVPIVDEIAANLGKFDNDGVPYPTGSSPWEVRVPTDLVVVQNLEEIPSILDVLTGKPITLLS